MHRTRTKPQRPPLTEVKFIEHDVKDCVWLKPKLVAQIEFSEWSSATFKVCLVEGI
jgi:ATP-dependent DNA ligase